MALLWSKLVRDGDRLSYWAPGQGSTRFSTAAAIEAHLAELLKRAEWKDQSVVVAIPDTLDEMGQEEILRAFGERRGDVQLLWRPVAAAMEWLHGLGTDFRIHPGDWMLVIYLGPDFFEFTPFGLQADGETGYPLPVRSRGIKNTLGLELLPRKYTRRNLAADSAFSRSVGSPRPARPTRMQTSLEPRGRILENMEREAGSSSETVGQGCHVILAFHTDWKEKFQLRCSMGQFILHTPETGNVKRTKSEASAWRGAVRAARALRQTRMA